jgi:PIN domain nuclease of toxin-antitoxin system
VNLLLDTHVLLWWLADDPKLGATTRAAIADGRNDVYVSAVTIAEIAIKRSQGKLAAPPELLQVLTEEGFSELPLLSTHAAALETLPWHHRDPFDRMLVAQATVEGLTLATADRNIPAYGVSVLAD